MPKGIKGTKGAKDSEDEVFQSHQRSQDPGLGSQVKGKKAEQYKCGDQWCKKFYNSYTAFYNHCKKIHYGEFPEGSLLNDKVFQGPSKNRGRPRLKKKQAKDKNTIQSTKRQHQLIEFLGTLKTKKSQQLIVYVGSSLELLAKLQKAIDIVLECLQREGSINKQKQHYLQGLKMFNRMVTENDLPQLYDPIESQRYRDKLDSYSFPSIFAFMKSPENKAKFEINYEGDSLLYKVLIVWFSRFLSQKLLSEVVYTLMMFQLEEKLIERELLVGRVDRFRELYTQYFQSIMQEENEGAKEAKEEN